MVREERELQGYGLCLLSEGHYFYMEYDFSDQATTV